MMGGRLFALALALGLAAASGATAAEKKYGPGVTDSEIKIGQTMPYSGPASAYGVLGMATSAYFRMLNQKGGVNGRKITFISLDNSYLPPKALEGVRRLVEQEHVLAIMGNLGTPTSVAIRQYLNDAHVPNLFIISGASIFDDPRHYPWTVPLIGQYRTEGRVLGRYILEQRPNAKIAVLYQADDLGKDYLVGLREVLGSRADEMIVATASYEVSDPTVDSQIVTLHGSGADVLVEFDSPKFAAEAIRKTYDLGWRPLHVVSLTGTTGLSALRSPGAEKSTGIITTAGKDPADPTWADDPEMKAYYAFMKAWYPGGDPTSGLALAGYAAGTFYAEVLRRCGDDLTREHLMEVVTHVEGVSTPLLFPGATIDYSPEDYDALKLFQLYRFDGTRLVPFGSLRRG